MKIRILLWKPPAFPYAELAKALREVFDGNSAPQAYDPQGGFFNGRDRWLIITSKEMNTEQAAELKKKLCDNESSVWNLAQHAPQEVRV